MIKRWVLPITLRLVLLLALSGFYGCSGSSTPAIPSTTFNQTSDSITSANGLSLTLSINSTSYHPGEQISVNIDEKNTLTTKNNVRVANSWPVQGLTVGPCGTLNYPFGIAILQ